LLLHRIFLLHLQIMIVILPLEP